MGNEQAWREYDALIRNGDFSSGSSDWERRERKQRELGSDLRGGFDKTAVQLANEVSNLRSYQRLYMEHRGDDDYGRQVERAAERVDDALRAFGEAHR